MRPDIKLTKLKMIMTKKGINRDEIHEKTKLAQPVLSKLIKGETIFRERTLMSMETFLEMPREQFLGFEGEEYVPPVKEEKVPKISKKKKSK